MHSDDGASAHEAGAGDEAEEAPLKTQASAVEPTAESVSAASAMPRPKAQQLQLPAVRVLICAMLFIALFLAYAQRVLLSIAIAPIAAEFGYDNSQRGIILSAFFVGYAVLQIPGGALATQHGGARVLAAGLLAASVVTLVTPLAAGSVAGMVTLRALCGLAQAVIYPSVHALMAAWAPAAERSIIVTIVWSGAFLGTTFTLPVAGALCAAPSSPTWWGMLAGWRLVFVLFSAAGVAWTALWALFGASTPEAHTMVRPAELRQIRGSLASSASAAAAQDIVPYRRLLSHPASIAIAVAHTAHNWQYYILLTWLPAFMRDQLGYDVHSAGVAAIGPYLASFIASVAAGVLADALIARGWRRITVRKSAQLVGELIPAAALIGVGYVTDARAAVPLLTIAVGFSGASTAGFGANHLDLCPRYAGILLGFANMTATMAGIVAPALVGWIVAEPHNDAIHWRIVFGIAAFVSGAGAIWYTLRAQTDLISDAYLHGGDAAVRIKGSPDLRPAVHVEGALADVAADEDAADTVRLTRPVASGGTRPRLVAQV